MKKKIVLSAIALSIVSTQAHASSTYFDARSAAMGGTGVASSKYGSAPLVNPALLSKHEEGDHATIILPNVGLQITDKDNIIDSFDAVSESYDDKDGTKLKKSLEDAKGISSDINVGANIVVAVPNKYLDAAFVANAYGTVNIAANVSQRDIDNADIINDGTLNDFDLLDSEGRAVAAAVQDYGLSLSKKVDVKGFPLYVGVTPKIQVIDTFNYAVAIEEFEKDDIDAKEFRGTNSGFNADLGIATDYKDFTVGLSVRNVLSRNIETKVMNEKSFTYKVAPLVTVGTAYRGKYVTVAADIDLTETNNFEHIEKSQYAGVGVELDAWNWAQLRAGYKADLKSNRPDMVTAGIGISPFDILHIDLAGQVGSDRSAGAVLGLSFTF